MCNYCSKKEKTSGLLKKPDNRNDSLFESAFCFILGSTLVIEYDAYSADSSFVEAVCINFCPMCGSELGVFKNKQPVSTNAMLDQFIFKNGGDIRKALYVALVDLKLTENLLNEQRRITEIYRQNSEKDTF